VFVRGLIITDVAQVHREFVETLTLLEEFDKVSRRLGRSAGGVVLPPGLALAGNSYRALLRAYGEFQRNLNELARVTAADATVKMRLALKQTAKRPDTRVRPHLATALSARPLPPIAGFPTGAVGIADIARLDKVVNPQYPGAGTYWRAQEYGSTHLVGTIIRGFFFGPGWSGDPTPPQNPPPSPLQPLFMPAGGQRAAFGDLGFSGGAGKRGGVGGFGTIQNPIQARHFIAKGADQAEITWRAGIAAIQKSAIAQIRRLSLP
jgi:hypothetical protein